MTPEYMMLLNNRFLTWLPSYFLVLVCNWHVYFNTVAWMINYTQIWDFSKWQTSIKMNLESQSIKKSFLRTLCVHAVLRHFIMESHRPWWIRTIADASQDSIKLAFWLLYACVSLVNILNITPWIKSPLSLLCPDATLSETEGKAKSERQPTSPTENILIFALD